MAGNLPIRLTIEGRAEAKQAFDEASRAGKDMGRTVATALDQAGNAADNLTQKTNTAAAAARQAQTATSAGSPVASPAGFSSSPAVGRETEALRRRLDEDYRNRRLRERDEGIIGRGQASGDFTDSYAERLRGLSSTKYGNDNDPSRRGLSTYDKSFIKYQGFDVAASLGSGASPVTTILQQGPQVLQQLADREGGLGAGLKQVGVTVAGLVTPFTVAAAAGTALGGAFLYAGLQAGKEQEAMERATRGLGGATGATASMISELAEANTKAGKVSSATAREITASYVSTGRIALPVIGDLTRVTSDYAKLTGQDIPSATAELSRAFSEPGKGVDDLAAKIGGLDDRTRQLVQTQIEQGDKAGAQKTAADYLKATVESNTAATTGWASAWLTVSSAADTAWTSLKRVAGVTLGATPEGAEAMVKRLKEELTTKRSPMDAALDPLGLDRERKRADLTAAEAQAAKEKTEAERKAFVERARTLSLDSNAIARGIDPNGARLSDLATKQSTLRDALSNPTYAETMSTEDFKRLRDGYDAVTQAKESLVDTNGKLISSEERTRQQNQLALDMAKATTDAEKAEIAAKQKRLELAGQTLTGSDRESQIDYAKRLSLASASSKGGGDSDKTDEFDRAVKSAQDRARRQGEEAQTYGQSADAVARYRVETELMTAATRAGRDVTPELTERIKGVAEESATAAKRVEDLRDAARQREDYRSIGSDGVRTLVRDLADGAGKAKTFQDVLGGIKSRVADLAATSLSDMIFGKRGSSSGGLLSGLLSGSGGGSFLSGLKSLLGFDGGGYTGPGGVLEAAGIVHRGEVVWSQRDVSRAGGVSTVEAMRLGVRGYDGGGYVGPERYTMPSATAMKPANTNGGPPVINFIPPPGMPLEADGPPQRNSSGGYDQALRMVGNGLAKQGAAGRGALREQFNTPASRIG